MCDFITQSSTLPFLEQFANTVVVYSAMWYMGAHWRYGEKGNILRKKLEKSFLRTSFAMCECNSQSYMFLLTDPFVYTVFLKSAMGYFLALCSWRWQREILRSEGERSCLRICFLMCDFISQSYTTISWSRFLGLFPWFLRSDIFDGFGEWKDKGNILREKPEWSFLRNCFVMCESFHSVIPPFHGGVS